MVTAVQTDQWGVFIDSVAHFDVDEINLRIDLGRETGSIECFDNGWG